jgi:hypothetical protein
MSGRTPPRVAGDNCDGGRRRRGRMPTARAVSRGSSRGYQAKISYSEMMHLVEHGEAFEHDDTSFRRFRCRRRRRCGLFELARAGGVGGAQESGNALAVRPAIPFALELPRCEAADVDMELVQSAVVTVSGELNLEVQLIPLDWAETRKEKETRRSS